MAIVCAFARAASSSRMRTAVFMNPLFRSIQQEYPVAVAVVVLLRRRKRLRTLVGKRLSGNGRVGPVCRVKPLGSCVRLQARHVHRDGPRGRHVDDETAVRSPGGGYVIALADGGLVDVAESSKPRGDYRMILVRNQILPRQGSKEVFPNGKLGDPGSVDISLPTILEGPGVLVAVELPLTTGQHGPILFASKHRRCSEIRRLADIL